MDSFKFVCMHLIKLYQYHSIDHSYVNTHYTLTQRQYPEASCYIIGNIVSSMESLTYENELLPEGQLLRLITVPKISFLEERWNEGMENRFFIKLTP